MWLLYKRNFNSLYHKATEHLLAEPKASRRNEKKSNSWIKMKAPGKIGLATATTHLQVTGDVGPGQDASC